MSQAGFSVIPWAPPQKARLPYSVHEDLQLYHVGRSYSDTLRFGVMRYAGKLLSLVDVRFKKSRLTGVGAWHNCWAH